MAESYDVVVSGGAVMGPATAFHLGKLGPGSVALFERGQICGGGTAKSCAILRTPYSIPTNTRLALCGFVDCGYLILGGDGGTAGNLLANLTRQAGEGAETLAIPREEARARHPLLTLEDVAAIGHEPRSGDANPYLTTMSFLKAARRLTGALLDRLAHHVHILAMNGESDRLEQSRSGRKKAR